MCGGVILKDGIVRPSSGSRLENDGLVVVKLTCIHSGMFVQ